MNIDTLSEVFKYFDHINRLKFTYINKECYNFYFQFYKNTINKDLIVMLSHPMLETLINNYVTKLQHYTKLHNNALNKGLYVYNYQGFLKSNKHIGHELKSTNPDPIMWLDSSKKFMIDNELIPIGDIFNGPFFIGNEQITNFFYSKKLKLISSDRRLSK
jgi:hypothetical protein